MSRMMKRVGAWMVAVVVAGVLAFGVKEAVAATTTDCDNNPPDTVGWQPSESACENACMTALGPDYIDFIWGPGNCCSCIY